MGKISTKGLLHSFHRKHSSLKGQFDYSDVLLWLHYFPTNTSKEEKKNGTQCYFLTRMEKQEMHSIHKYLESLYKSSTWQKSYSDVPCASKGK